MRRASTISSGQTSRGNSALAEWGRRGVATPPEAPHRSNAAQPPLAAGGAGGPLARSWSPPRAARKGGFEV